ncbi:MAG TPA: glycosyltransferase family 1 protein [Chloroflexota bacterium]|nr:glycosyltransferase family 1 protein [Chloroflexota bacterium]
MRVAVDFTAGVRQHGGVGRYTRSLVRGLAHEASARGGGDQLTLLWAGPARLAPPSAWPATRTRRLPLPERWMTVLWQRLRLPLPADALAGGADVFYSPDFTLPPLARAAAAVTVHDLSYLIHPDTHYPPLRRYLEAAVPRALDRAARVFADSEQTRDDLRTYLSVPPERVDVVLSAADPLFRPAAAAAIDAARRAHRIDRPYLISVGTIQPRKNLPAIFTALRELVDGGHDLLLVHVGRPGWLFEPIFAALEQSGVKERVRFVAASDEDLVALYSGAEALVFPSLYEGFGIPCLEAMACGTPVIASHAGSLAEVVEDAGIKVEPHDSTAIAAAVRRLLDEPVFRRDLIERGFAQNAKFRWERAARQVYDALASLAS